MNAQGEGKASRDSTLGGGKRRAICGGAWRWASALVSVLVVAACGGGGGGEGPIPAFDAVGGVVVADLDGDGLQDVAAAVAHVDGPPPHPGAVKVWLQRADQPGSFEPAARYEVGPDPWVLRVADLDGDGVLDLVAMSSHSSAVASAPLVDSVTVLRGDPAQRGRFMPGVALHAGARLADIATSDLDGDGAIDIAFTSYGADARVAVWWNDAAAPGTFAAPAQIVPGAAGALVAADLDADGLRDLAYVVGDEVWTAPRLAGAARSFATPVRVGGGSLLTCLAPADLDLDGRTDLVFGSRATSDVGAPGELVSLRQDPALAGRFLPWQQLPLAVHAWPCVVADLDRNGWPDVVTSGAGVSPNLFDDLLAVFLDAHAVPGRLAPAVQTVARDTSSGYHLAVGDVDNDGRPEVVMPYRGGVLAWRQDPAAPGALRRGLELP